MKQNKKDKTFATMLCFACMFIGIYVLIASLVNFGLSFVGFINTWLIWYLLVGLGTIGFGLVSLYIIFWCAKEVWSEV